MPACAASTKPTTNAFYTTNAPCAQAAASLIAARLPSQGSFGLGSTGMLAQRLWLVVATNPLSAGDGKAGVRFVELEEFASMSLGLAPTTLDPSAVGQWAHKRPGGGEKLKACAQDTTTYLSVEVKQTLHAVVASR